MNLMQILSTIEKMKGGQISQSEFARVLEITPPALSKRIKNHGEISVSELIKFEQHYKCGLFDVLGRKAGLQDAVEIIYYENPTLIEIIKNPVITSIWLDRELVHDIWKKDEKNLRTLQMPGDAMDGGDNPIKNKDMLIVDMSDKNPMASGIFAYTTQGESLIFVNDIKQRADGALKFNFWNTRYKEAVYTPDDLKKMDFKVIGRVVKNMSL